jgi:hypothetical protein
MYRLFIDIPISASSTEEAVEVGKQIMYSTIENEGMKNNLRILGVEQVNYRLGHDEDRQKSNYFIVNDKGHCSNKKSRVVLNDDVR